MVWEQDADIEFVERLLSRHSFVYRAWRLGHCRYSQPKRIRSIHPIIDRIAVMMAYQSHQRFKSCSCTNISIRPYLGRTPQNQKLQGTILPRNLKCIHQGSSSTYVRPMILYNQIFPQLTFILFGKVGLSHYQVAPNLHKPALGRLNHVILPFTAF